MGQKIVVSLQSPEDHYVADACAIFCVDERFKSANAALEVNKGWYKVDRLTLPGGAQAFAHDDVKEVGDVGKVFAWGADIAKRLHHAKRLALTIHEGCGAYGEAMPKGRDKALIFIEGELRKAAKTAAAYLETKKVQIPVETYAVMFDGVYEIT